MTHRALLAKPENYTPPTGNPDDCICGANGNPDAGRLLIPNCPCCDGVQGLVEGDCECDNPTHFRVIMPPKGSMRIRYIDKVEAIS